MSNVIKDSHSHRVCTILDMLRVEAVSVAEEWNVKLADNEHNRLGWYTS